MICTDLRATRAIYVIGVGGERGDVPRLLRSFWDDEGFRGFGYCGIDPEEELLPIMTRLSLLHCVFEFPQGLKRFLSENKRVG